MLADVIQRIALREVGEAPRTAERHHVLIELRDVAGFGEGARLGVGDETIPSLEVNRKTVVDYLAPVRERYAELRPDEAAIEGTLAAGADKARAIAADTLADVREAMGIGPPRG